ncbi:MAG: alpha/beta hydrolase [Bacteroidetes bacterium]|nr:alpha/beta hydrolase [Bacteroidota bacterium]
MLYLFIILILILFFGVMLALMSRVYKVHPKSHKHDPASIGISFEEVYFGTKNNLSLYGWWMTSGLEPKRPVIILVHGWSRNVERMLPYIKMLHKNFDLLAFDSRCHGSSDEDSYSSMPRFAEDIIAAIEFVQFKKPHCNLGVLGLSMGGAASIYAASKDERIKAVVTVGAFAHPADVMRQEFKKRHIPYFPLVWLLFEYIQHLMNDRFDNIAPEKNISRSKSSILLIHGTEDQTAPVEQAKRLFEASNPNRTELLLLEGMGHSDCHEYPGIDDRVREFLLAKLQ